MYFYLSTTVWSFIHLCSSVKMCNFMLVTCQCFALTSYRVNWWLSGKWIRCCSYNSEYEEKNIIAVLASVSFIIRSFKKMFNHIITLSLDVKLRRPSENVLRFQSSRQRSAKSQPLTWSLSSGNIADSV